MFSKKDEKRPLNRIDSLIGVGTHVEGNIRFAGGLRVDGSVRGDIEAQAADAVLVLSETSRVEGRVSVAHLVINGQVLGPVSAAESLELQPRARIVGDVDYAVIEMHQGAVIEGRLVHRSPDSATDKEPKKPRED